MGPRPHLMLLNKKKKGVPLSYEHRNKMSLTKLNKFNSGELILSTSQKKGLEIGRQKTVNRERFCLYCSDKFDYVNKEQRFCSRTCNGLYKRGSNNPNWKGGFFLERRPRDTIEYKEWRTKVYQRDNYTCQTCSIKGGQLVAHHIKSWKSYPGLRYEVSNGLTLCTPCHKKTHNYGWNLKWNIGE